MKSLSQPSRYQYRFSFDERVLFIFVYDFRLSLSLNGWFLELLFCLCRSWNIRLVLDFEQRLSPDHLSKTLCPFWWINFNALVGCDTMESVWSTQSSDRSNVSGAYLDVQCSRVRSEMSLSHYWKHSSIPPWRVVEIKLIFLDMVRWYSMLVCRRSNTLSFDECDFVWEINTNETKRENTWQLVHPCVWTRLLSWKSVTVIEMANQWVPSVQSLNRDGSKIRANICNEVFCEHPVIPCLSQQHSWDRHSFTAESFPAFEIR
jgi:hypothetical protein